MEVRIKLGEINVNFSFHEDYVEGILQFGKIRISSDESKGFRPYELLVSSIAGCSGAVFYKIIKKQRIKLESFEMDVEVERNKEKANKIEKMILHFKVKGMDLNEHRLQRNLIIARKNCAMIRSIEESIHVEEKLTILK